MKRKHKQIAAHYIATLADEQASIDVERSKRDEKNARARARRAAAKLKAAERAEVAS